jgi:hypothetical protein
MRKQLTSLHAIAVDRYGPVADWHIKTDENGTSTTGLAGCVDWHIKLDEQQQAIDLSETVSGRQYALRPDASGRWTIVKK